VEPSPDPIRVLVAEDSGLLREGLGQLLRSAGFEVVGAAANYTELLAMANTTEPHVILTDIKMPPSHSDEGLRAAEAIRAQRPDTAIILLSHYAEPEFAQRLLSGEPRGLGYLLKDRVSDAGELGAAIRRVVAGETVVDPDVIAILVSRRRSPGDRLEKLTGRERQILELMAEGRSNLGIARAEFLSTKTVERHVASIFSKLGLEPGTDENRRVLAVLQQLRA
jgi:DNA-binding NarL/FixJ family response regulator